MKCQKDQPDEILKHLNSIKPDVIVFTKENQEADVLPLLDLKQKVDRKTKQIECMVHYKKTKDVRHTFGGKDTNSPISEELFSSAYNRAKCYYIRTF